MFATNDSRLLHVLRCTKGNKIVLDLLILLFLTKLILFVTCFTKATVYPKNVKFRNQIKIVFVLILPTLNLYMFSSTGLIILIGHREEIRELKFPALALRRSESIRSDEGLTLEMPALESLYGGQFTLSTQLIKPNYLAILPPTQHHMQFL